MKTQELKTQEMPIAVGQTLRVEHSRKGTFAMRITVLDETWMTGTIVDGDAQALSEDNVKTVGESITIRRSLVVRSTRLDSSTNAP